MHHRDRRRELRWQACCLLDREGHFLNASPSLASFFHCDGGSLRGQSIFMHMDEAEAAQVAPMLAAAASGAPRAFQLRLHGPGGAPTWMRISLRPGGSEAGAPVIVACLEPPAGPSP